MQGSENNPLNLDYAQEWITFLKRRNLILTIVWPILLVVSVLSIVVAIYYYQTQVSSNIQLSLQTQENSALAKQNQELQSELASMEEAKQQLQSDLTSLQNAREELSLQNNDSENKLNITSQMVDNLNQLVSELKNERESLVVKLEDALAKLSSVEQEYEEFVELSKKKNIKSVSELNKQLASSKSAYKALANRQREMRDDMDSLRNQINLKDKKLEKTNKEKQKLLADLKNKANELEAYSKRLAALQENFSALESKLNAMVTPISASPSVNTPPELPKSEVNMTGLEEIKKPVQAKQEDPAAENFDFNKITISP